ncbi:hypothetical protein PSTT_06687 [Puccinia striiformis]|uniref:Ribosome biogenesis protein NOP53 n=1 Tax=Puccinia striiformis TaxID=27350 RepID=A0A2S4VJK4_9BASI|nr:hypothetical protein PSTT_06687 [Puccinia striiformis]
MDTVTPIKPPSSLKPNKTLVEVVNSVPAAVMAIPLPHPGQSYSPAPGQEEDQGSIAHVTRATEVSAKIDYGQTRSLTSAKRAALVAEYRLQAVRGGKVKGLQAVQDRHKCQLTEDLTESGLRGLKPEGNLWRDWSQSNTRIGKLDNRTKIGLVKGQRFQKG